MSALERLAFVLFIATCIAFIAAVFIMVDILATNELRLNQ